MADEQPITLPEGKPVADPTGEFGPDSFDLDKKRKRKAPKKVPGSIQEESEKILNIGTT